ncbi:uncharacterized protein EI90DRAFT_528661 [Cantharellus anzutake]|uniref:uncharacterized protein n=1 Tax=Cantharellus anzutake TaxID=1750568 RepID=UPI001904EEBE|nr:uncharacterized protein EI90DRAFT_528661 [Cantharellus anzutake]KAF8334254.1 hypothetical protein EI90DRAFT_528661 [Cantharellus anzutake]
MPALPNTLSFSQSRRWIVKLASTLPDIPFHWQRGQPRRLVSRTATGWASKLSVATDSSPSGDQDKSVAYQFGALAVGVLCGVALLVVIVVAWLFVVRRGVLDKDVEETTRYLSFPATRSNQPAVALRRQSMKIRSPLQPIHRRLLFIPFRF